MQNMFSGTGSMGNLLSMLATYGIIIGGMYFLLFRPQQKKKKQEDEMRQNVKIGDEIVTIGGIVGKVISVKNDGETLVIESSSNKLKIQTWAIAQVFGENK